MVTLPTQELESMMRETMEKNEQEQRTKFLQQQEALKRKSRFIWRNDEERCCTGLRKELDRAITGSVKILWTGQFMTVFSVLIFIAAWAVFIGGMVWSETYYWEYYCVVSTNGVNTTAASGKNVTDPKVEVAGYQLPVSEEKKCMPNNPIRRHFPMKASHWIPGIIISLSFLCMCGFTFRPITEDSIEAPDNVSAREIASYCACLKNAFLLCTVSWASIGLFVAIIYFILMVSFVDVRGEGQAHVSVPTVCVVIQCFMLVGSLCTGFLSKWLYLRAEVLDEDHIQ